MHLPVSEEQFARFVAEAYQRVPAVRRLLDGAGLAPDRLRPAAELLSALPVTSKEELSKQQQENPPFGGWVAGGLQELARVFVSPGPIYNVEAAVADDWGATEALGAAGFRAGDLVLNSFSYHLSPASFIVEAGLRALGVAVIPAGTTSKSEQVRLLRRLPVSGFAGVPSYLKALLDELRQEAVDGRGPVPVLALRRAWFTAERLDEPLRRHLEEAWGIEAYQGYGTAEVGIVAYECPYRSGMHLGSQVVVELLDPQTRRPVPPGETGEVVVTPLRRAYPLLRLATGDLSRIIDEPCPCGRRSLRMAGVLGRVGSGVKVRGMFVYPHQVEELSRSVSGAAKIAALVARRSDRDFLTLEVEPASPGPEPLLAERVSEAARDRLRVRPDAVRIVAPGSLEGRPVLVDQRTEGEGRGSPPVSGVHPGGS